MSAAPRLSSADHVLINAVGWVVNDVMGDESISEVMFGTILEVLPAVTAEISIVQKFARIGAELVAANSAGDRLGRTRLRGDAQRAFMQLYASRVGDALEVFRKGDANAKVLSFRSGR